METKQAPPMPPEIEKIAEEFGAMLVEGARVGELYPTRSYLNRAFIADKAGDEYSKLAFFGLQTVDHREIVAAVDGGKTFVEYFKEFRQRIYDADTTVAH